VLVFAVEMKKWMPGAAAVNVVPTATELEAEVVTELEAQKVQQALGAEEAVSASYAGAR